MLDQRLALPLVLAAGIGIGTVIQSPNPQEPILQANLYMQNSAEYRAVCLQTYSWAEAMLRYKVRTRQSFRDHANKPLAVVMDLDETVVDNAAFQCYLDRKGLAYQQDVWNSWEKSGEGLRLIPGVESFLKTAKDLGVKPIFLSNRQDSLKEFTAAKLTSMGLTGFEISFMTNTSDKTARRKAATDKYDVVMYVGDNLRDFDERFKAPSLTAADKENYAKLNGHVEARKSTVDATAARFGSEWIILPNPVYGEWDKLSGSDPHKMLRDPFPMP